MTAPKGESQKSQSFVYKAGKTPELHDKDVADRMKADEGWFDNPTDAKDAPKAEPKANVEAAPKPAAKPRAKKPTKKAAKGK